MALTFYDTGDNTSALRIARVRRLAGNLTSDDIADAAVIEILNRQDNWMITQLGITDNSNFTSSDVRWTQGLHAGELMSAAEVNDGIPTNAAATKAKDQRIAARDVIKAVNRLDSEIQNNNIYVAKGVNVQEQNNPDYYIQDTTDNLTGIT